MNINSDNDAVSVQRCLFNCYNVILLSSFPVCLKPDWAHFPYWRNPQDHNCDLLPAVEIRFFHTSLPHLDSLPPPVSVVFFWLIYYPRMTSLPSPPSSAEIKILNFCKRLSTGFSFFRQQSKSSGWSLARSLEEKITILIWKESEVAGAICIPLPRLCFRSLQSVTQLYCACGCVKTQ